MPSFDLSKEPPRDSEDTPTESSAVRLIESLITSEQLFRLVEMFGVLGKLSQDKIDTRITKLQSFGKTVFIAKAKGEMGDGFISNSHLNVFLSQLWDRYLSMPLRNMSDISTAHTGIMKEIWQFDIRMSRTKV